MDVSRRWGDNRMVAEWHRSDGEYTKLISYILRFHFSFFMFGNEVAAMWRLRCGGWDGLAAGWQWSSREGGGGELEGGVKVTQRVST